MAIFGKSIQNSRKNVIFNHKKMEGTPAFVNSIFLIDGNKLFENHLFYFIK